VVEINNMRVFFSRCNGLIVILVGLLRLLSFDRVFFVAHGYVIVNMNSESTAGPRNGHQPTVNIANMPYGYRYPLKSINVCVDCEDPAEDGTFVLGLNAKYGVSDYDITGELVYCVPNLADVAILNGYQFANRIVMVNRGGNALIEKVLKAQNEGAVGQ
jgi:hypothetical protein